MKASVLLSALGLLACSLQPLVARAQSKADLAAAEAPGAPDRAAIDEAQLHFKRGVELYNDGDFNASSVEFRRAYETAPNYKVLYNLGQVQAQLQDYVGGLKAFQRYLAEGGAQIRPERRAEVEREIQKLQGRVGKIEIVVNLSDVEVALDDLLLGKSPFTEPVAVSSGRRKLTASKAGRILATRSVDVAGGDQLKVQFDLVAPPDTTGSPPSRSRELPRAAEPHSAPPSTASTSSSPFPWWGWVATGALASGATVTGILALGASSKLADERSAYPASKSRIDEQQRRTQTFALTADVLSGTAVVMGALSLYLTVRSSRTTNAASNTTIVAGPALPYGWAVAGSF